MSPTVFREGPYRFFFSREESRIHVHVRAGEKEAKFWRDPEVVMAQNVGFNTPELGVVESLVEAHRDEIRAAWSRFFIR